MSSKGKIQALASYDLSSFYILNVGLQERLLPCGQEVSSNFLGSSLPYYGN
jgi:hypothetical protein